MRLTNRHRAAFTLQRFMRGFVAIIALALQLAALAHLHLGERPGADDSHCVWCAVAHSPAVLATAPPTPARALITWIPRTLPTTSAPPAPAFDSAPARAPPAS